MKLPKRTKQHRSEDRSLAILKYKLGDLGIFRDQGTNDYGIDCELELVQGDQVTGRIVKAQVKSSDGVTPRKDGTPTVGGIKQSTLNYWCEHSFNANVLAFLVDIENEDIYLSQPIFAQASRLIDGSERSKTIEFQEMSPALDLVTLKLAIAPRIGEVVAAHSAALRNIDKFLELLVGAYHYDAPMEIHDPEHFAELLESAAVLLWDKAHILWSEKADRRGWTSDDYWKHKSEAQGFDGISFYASREPLVTILPALFTELHRLQCETMAAKYYWAFKNPNYLKLVYKHDIPQSISAEELREIGYTQERFHRKSGWSPDSFVMMAKDGG